MDKNSVYNALPYPLQVLAASVRGLNLRGWRYGSDTEKIIEETSTRETWTTKQWKQWQEEQMAFILHRAARHVPYYRDYWQKQRQIGNKASSEYLGNWPLLKKEIVRNHPEAFVADDVNLKSLFLDHTGGTSGRPTLIYESRTTILQWYAIFEARVRRWHQVSYKEKWGMFGGQKIVPLTQKKPPFWVRNYGLNQLYFSIFHITKDTAKYYVDALNQFSPTHLIAYPSALSVLAFYILDLGLVPPKLRVIFTNSEKVITKQKKLIQDAFNCPVIDTYGMAELTSAGSECKVGTLHYWPESGFMEIFDKSENKCHKNNNRLGEFVMTSIINKDMPLIRYLNGDIGSLPIWDYGCPCGRNLPKFGSINGRQNDLITTADGRRLYLLDSLFNGLPLIEAQLIQESLNSFIVFIVPGEGFDLNTVSKKIEVTLNEYLGPIHTDIQIVTDIPRNQNGKFQPFISRLGNEEFLENC